MDFQFWLSVGVSVIVAQCKCLHAVQEEPHTHADGQKFNYHHHVPEGLGMFPVP